MPTPDPHTRAHLEWLGFIQPNGLVVSAPALVKAGAILNRHDVEGQELLDVWVNQRDGSPACARERGHQDFRAFAKTVLGWGFSPKGYAGTDEAPVPAEIEVPLPDYGETLRPDFAVRERDPQAGESPWQLLVRVLGEGEDFDKPTAGAGGLESSPQGRMERLLRSTGVPAGVLFNGVALRLVSAPRGESSGWMDFRVADMAQTAGRPLCAALRLLLCEQRLLTGPREHRLAALLADSRRYQSEVSERLSEQVMHALYGLLRGFQAAHDASRGELLREPLSAEGDSNDVYRGLLAVILRLVFLLYAEERGMLPGDDETFSRHYSVAGLYRRLREDAALHPDTMDQRFGAWAQLLVLFRLIHDGAGGHKTGGTVRLPERRGALFDPDRYPFLEGRRSGGGRQITERVQPPLVSDGAVYRVLEKLVVLDGERISYRTLDVEQIGSVYEVIMGFRLETAAGRSVAVKSAKKLGAPSTVNLDELANQPGERRGKWLQDRVDRTLTDTVKRELREANTVDDLHLALDRVLDKDATPDLVTPGSLVLQPSDERRRSGSNYTPRELTEPIVRHTLEPLLDRLRPEDGRAPAPARILDLKICDPAMGSGAFLVETCRQLADALIEAWHAHDETPAIPPDEDEVVHARRLVAQRCLYGIDRNPMAVDLAKTSLWLSTLARDHPLTFLDHAFRHGDSLVGLTREQIEAFHWIPDSEPLEKGFEVMRVREHMTRVGQLRRAIRDAGEEVSDQELHGLWQDARAELDAVRLFGDLAVMAFFAEGNPRRREARRREFAQAVVDREANRYLGWIEGLRHSEPSFAPFHWEIEFPEVFDRQNPGFDAFVGNPPFAGGRKLSATAGEVYAKWLLKLHQESSGGADLAAHFYRRAFHLVRVNGAFGLIATNTIAQGDTRSSGLRWICEHGGEIYRAQKRVGWPGDAAVVVSVLHVLKGEVTGKKILDGTDVEKITAFLFRTGGHADPVRLDANARSSFQGSIVLGMGFTFDDADKKGVANSISDMKRLIEIDPTNSEVIFPYIGGEEVNSSPTHAYHRYVINFREFPLLREETSVPWVAMEEGQRTDCLKSGRVPLDYPDPVAADWPALLSIVERRVRPERIGKDAKKYPRMVFEWWKHWNARRDLEAAVAGLDQVLVISRYCQSAAFTFLPAGWVYSDSIVVFPFDTYAAFCVLQSRTHEIWARFLGSSMKDDLRYTPSDCFETFPFPDGWETCRVFDGAGREYYEHRANLMIDRNEGMTRTYNRFHHPCENDPEIIRLRELHATMDRVVLDAYGWTDIPINCDFFLDYEIDETTWGAKKKPYRYRWPDEICDEVLARLLALNAERSKEEVRARLVQKPVRKKRHRVLMVAEQAPLWDRPLTDQTPQRFTPLVKHSRPKPSTIYPVLWKFACERQRIYLRRVAGEPSPWTTDTVLSEYKFTNAFRAADRVSQYLIHLIYSDAKASGASLFLRALLFKIFNKIETWDRIVSGFGMPVAHEFDYAACDDLLDNLRRQRAPIYSAAYIMPSGGRAGMPKHQMHLELIRRMLDERLPEKLQESKSLADAYEMVLSYPTLGPFLAFQYVIDLNYSTLMNHSEQKFVVAGPGALDGLSKCFESLGEYSAADAILWLSDIQADEFARYGLDFEGLWGRPLQPIDVQNLFCEVSKYTRVTHPEIGGRTGRKRIKQRFAMTGPLAKPFFPPKWGLNQRIDEWLARQTGATLEQRELLLPTPAKPM